MISKVVRDAILGQLSMPNSGFNARVALLAPDYGVDPYIIDWTNTSVNFIFGQVQPDKFEESTVFTYPLMTIDTAGVQDLGLIYSATFGGRIAGVIDVHHSWPDGSVMADFSSLVDMTEDAIITCLQYPEQQHYPRDLNFLRVKGGLTSMRTQISFGGENWRQSLRITVPFQLVV